MKFKEYLYEENTVKIPDFKIIQNGKPLVSFKELLSEDNELKMALRKYALEDKWDGQAFNSLMNIKPDQDTLNGIAEMMDLGSLFLKCKFSALIHFKTLAPFDNHFESFTFRGKDILFRIDKQDIHPATYHIQIESGSGSYKITKLINKSLDLTINILDVLKSQDFTMNRFYRSCKKIGYEQSLKLDEFRNINLSAWVLFK